MTTTYQLVAFDMDSTLIQAECIDELAKEAGVGEQVAAVTEAAMRGELDFAQSLTQRVTLLKGLPETVLAKVAKRIAPTPGMPELCEQLNQQGMVTAILSGGFTFFADQLQQAHGFDFVLANELIIEEGKLTGEVTLPIVDANAKAQGLIQLAQQHDIDLANTVAVGDGANDLLMMQAAGLGIAFCAKPKVKEQADLAIDDCDLLQVATLINLF